MIQLEEKNDLDPLCPHCDAPIQNVFFQELRGVFGRRYIYFCAHCQKCLGVSHRKGFLMG